MNRKKILMFVLLLLVGVALTVLAELTGSDFLRNLVFVCIGSMAGYIVSNDSEQKMFNRSPKEWIGFAAAVLIITTLFWLIEKFIF